MEDIPRQRDLVFISKATPGDDNFVLWLAPKLEAAGYLVFADILNLDAGDRWRRVLTEDLRQRAVKMLLCCSNDTLKRDGVLEEIDIALQVSKHIDDPNFILPLRLQPYEAPFGLTGLQYTDFVGDWAGGLAKLLKALNKQNVPKASRGEIQPQWEQYLRRREVEVEPSPETLTSNWLRVVRAPDELLYVQPKGACTHATMLKLGRQFCFPMIPFKRGFLTFASPEDMEEHFQPVGRMVTTKVFPLRDFMEHGCDEEGISRWDASNKILDLMRQAWERFCRSRGFLAYEYANGVWGFHVDENLIELGRRVPWGKQGSRRSNALRNIKRGKVWEYGVSATPSLFPFPHYRLKGRVLFSDMEDRKKTVVIPDTDKQHTLRRSLCSGWRNKAWHGRLMAFIELMVGESPYVSMPVGSGSYLTADAMPILVTSPVTAAQAQEEDDDAEEEDLTTLGGYVPGEET